MLNMARLLKAFWLKLDQHMGLLFPSYTLTSNSTRSSCSCHAASPAHGSTRPSQLFIRVGGMPEPQPEPSS
ncbi:uncharacterized [Tachysurus ichikawai]